MATHDVEPGIGRIGTGTMQRPTRRHVPRRCDRSRPTTALRRSAALPRPDAGRLSGLELGPVAILVAARRRARAHVRRLPLAGERRQRAEAVGGHQRARARADAGHRHPRDRPVGRLEPLAQRRGRRDRVARPRVGHARRARRTRHRHGGRARQRGRLRQGPPPTPVHPHARDAHGRERARALPRAQPDDPGRAPVRQRDRIGAHRHDPGRRFGGMVPHGDDRRGRRRRSRSRSSPAGWCGAAGSTPSAATPRRRCATASPCRRCSSPSTRSVGCSRASRPCSRWARATPGHRLRATSPSSTRSPR